MKKRNSSKTSVNVKPVASAPADGSSAVTSSGFFTFPNGDKYNGEYTIFKDPFYVVREGPGVYDTDDFNKYQCKWSGDKINSDLFIRYNNHTEYRGSVDENGKMSGQGTYFLPDGSSIDAEWKENQLFRHIRYEEPLGFIWRGEISNDGKEVYFMAGNHFWDDMSGSDDKKIASQASDFDDAQ